MRSAQACGFFYHLVIQLPLVSSFNSSAAWTLLDSGKHIYESVEAFASMPDGPRGIFQAPDGTWHKFVEYGTRLNLECVNELAGTGGCIYMGYGIVYDSTRQKIIIRMQRPIEMETQAAVPNPGDLDPNAIRMKIFDSSDSAVKIRAGSNLVWTGINVRGGRGAFDADGASTGLFIAETEMWTSGRTTVTFETGFTAAAVTRSIFRDFVPLWISWADVKSNGRDVGGNAFQVIFLSAINIGLLP